MRRVIVSSVEALATELRAHATEFGVSSDNIYRAWNPTLDCETLSDNQTSGVHVLLYTQDSDLEKELVAGVERTIPVAVTVVAYVPSTDCANVDPMIHIFEDIQTHIACLGQIVDTAGQGYAISNVVTNDLVNQDWIRCKIVFCRLDLELQTHVE